MPEKRAQQAYTTFGLDREASITSPFVNPAGVLESIIALSPVIAIFSICWAEITIYSSYLVVLWYVLLGT